MKQNLIAVAVPSTRGGSISLKSMDFKVVNRDGEAIIEGEVFLQMMGGRDHAVLMSSDMADELLAIYVEKMGITPEMLQQFIDDTKMKAEVKLADAGIEYPQNEQDPNEITGRR